MKRDRLFSSHLPIQLRLISVFVLTSLLSLSISLLMNRNISSSLETINRTYVSNRNLYRMTSTLEDLNQSVQEYLELKSTDSLNRYYYNVQEYREQLEDLDVAIRSSGSMEKNIYEISQSYLDTAEQAIEAKRARNTVGYRDAFAKAGIYYQYLTAYIYSLNNQQFLNNSRDHQSLVASFRHLNRINNLMILATSLFNIILIIILVRQITRPLLNLADASGQVAQGNFNVEVPARNSGDELGVVTGAFNEMVRNIREYIEKVRSSMEAEKKAQERELLMANHLKDAQLRYYQAQINPHFLFNSLNAGAQMAVMEDAERTYMFLQNMADFFRYSMKSLQTDVELAQEIELVKNYLAIMNVRFAGEIHFREEISCSITGIQVPCMIIQPAVENAILHGISGLEWESLIRLIIQKDDDHILIRIIDNGHGIKPEQLEQIRNGELLPASGTKSSNGIGMGNVRERLKLYYQEDDLLEIDSPGIDLGTIVTIRIPLTGPVSETCAGSDRILQPEPVSAGEDNDDTNSGEDTAYVQNTVSR